MNTTFVATKFSTLYLKGFQSNGITICNKQKCRKGYQGTEQQGQRHKGKDNQKTPKNPLWGV